MGRHQDATATLWVLIDKDAVAVCSGDWNSPEPIGLQLYGDISADRLRKVNVGNLALLTGKNARPPMTWDHAPTAAEVRDGYERLLRFQIAFPEWTTKRTKSGTRLVASKKVVPVYDFDSVGDFIRYWVQGDKVTDEQTFSWCFAFALKSIAPTVPSAHKTIAKELGLSDNTVKAYVLRARKHGYLPPSRRSKS